MKVLLPCADGGIKYYANRFPMRDSKGKMLMEGAHQGRMFGNIYSKKFNPTSATKVRLVIKASLKEFHLFPPAIP